MDLPEILGYNPKLVIAEKPFCNDHEEAEQVVEYYNMKNIPILVDYIRRFDDAIVVTQEQIIKGELGEIFNCRILYNRGLLRDGCHALNIFQYFFGECKSVCVNKDVFYNDLNDYDLSYDVQFEFERCKNVQFTPVDGRKVAVFEIDIVSEKGRFVFVDFGLKMKFFDLKKQGTYGDYKGLRNKPIVIKTELNMALYYLVNNAVNFLDGKCKLLCTGENALKTQKLISQIREALNETSN
jgi:predicted dehydrogenase